MRAADAARARLPFLAAAACLAACASERRDGALVISEVMYHPVLEAGADDHEFIEIHNPGQGGVDVAGWKLRIDGEDRYTFPEGTNIAAGAYRVVARNRQALAQVAAYQLREKEVLGDYQGELDNDGGQVALVDAAGHAADTVAYDDRWPWPVGADALGAGEGWLPAEQQPLDAHRFMGRSLERRSLQGQGAQVGNWEASPLDGATPGRSNTVAGAPAVVVTSLRVQAEDGGRVTAAPVAITAALSDGPTEELSVEYFVDELGRDGEARASAPMLKEAGGWRAVLPAHAEESIVRYRILGRRGGQPAPVETLSPRASDPFAWHAYFVGPPREAEPVYRLFVAPADWTALWTNLTAFGGAGPAPNYGCHVNPTYNDRVPAVFVAGGQVHDVRVRYQGGRSQRAVGPAIPIWEHPGPRLPAPLRALSWNVSFPRYAPFGKRRQLVLKKSWQACPGVVNAAVGDLFWQAGIPSDRFGFARVRINGGYYDYMIDVDPLSEDVLRRFEGGGVAGDLFKADGWGRDEAAWGLSDFSPMRDSCGFSAWERYATSYERQSNDFKRGRDDPELAELVAMIGGLAAARDQGVAATRAFLERAFDVGELLTVFAMRNFLGAWDDAYHNYQLYKRPSDGRWLVLPLDFDNELGGDPNGRWPMYAHPPSSSLYIGQAGNGSNRLPYINRIKDAVLGSFRSEFDDRLRELAGGVLSPENLLATIDRVQASFDRDAWNESPAVKDCVVDARVQAARTWIEERHLVLRYLGVR